MCKTNQIQLQEHTKEPAQNLGVHELVQGDSHC